METKPLIFDLVQIVDQPTEHSADLPRAVAFEIQNSESNESTNLHSQNCDKTFVYKLIHLFLGEVCICSKIGIEFFLAENRN